MRVDFAEDGTITRRDDDDLLHAEQEPALERPDGTVSFWHHGVLHNDHGPAVRTANGTRIWMRHGKIHRDDGPAIEPPQGRRQLWRDGVFVAYA